MAITLPPPKTDFFRPRRWPVWIGLGLLRAFGWLPFRALYVLGSVLGMAFRAISARRRRVADINIAQCFPDLTPEDRHRLVRAHFRAFGQAFLATSIAWWGSAERVRRLVRLRDTHHLEQTLASGRNVILLAPHFIGLEIGGIRVSADWPMVTVFAEPENPVVAHVMHRARMRFRMQTMAGHRASLMQLVKTVARGVPLYYLPDQNPDDRHFVFAPFFGVPAATYTTLSRLARMTNALVIPCVTYVLPRGAGFETVFAPPLAPFPTDDAVADATLMNHAIEQLVACYPAQYQWCYKRFKTRPPGTTKLY